MKRTIHILLVALAAIVGSAPAIMAEPAVEKAVTEKLEDTVEAAEKEKPDLKETIFEHLGDGYGWEVPFNHHKRMPLPIIVIVKD